MGYSRKKIQTGGVEGIHFDRKNPWNFNKFVTLPLEIPNKTSGQNKASPLKIHEIVLQKHVAPLKF